MKSSDLKKAYKIQEAIEQIENKIERIEAGHDLGITISGTYQQESFVDAIRPHVIDHMTKGLNKLKNDLRELGIDPE